MQRTRIKICGVTRPEDAATAARAGADAIGMIFYPPAPRNISPERARAIIEALPPFVTPVGVFVDASPEEILDQAAVLGLRTVQLNGAEPPADVAEMEGLQVIKAIRVSRATLATELNTWRTAIARGLPNLIGLVMEPTTEQAGGSGVANDWPAIAEAINAGAFEGLPALIAAGGLRAETVADVVTRIRPWAVDVSSGVEASLGAKSPEKIEAFVRAVREADAAGTVSG
ncbi:MAG TPA: phosphoribosylanthranilate isomerase [Tepidisphaeraceae bacterium]|nr:phosphoribosylanthranilate isomerase [Tepidisphaeraceae bacterium]